jgi:hypothetical protein
MVLHAALAAHWLTMATAVGNRLGSVQPRLEKFPYRRV